MDIWALMDGSYMRFKSGDASDWVGLIGVQFASFLSFLVLSLGSVWHGNRLKKLGNGLRNLGGLERQRRQAWIQLQLYFPIAILTALMIAQVTSRPLEAILPNDWINEAVKVNDNSNK